MRYYMSSLFILLIFYNIYAQSHSNDKSESLKTIEEKTTKMEKFEGYFTFYWDAKNGKIWLEIDKWNTEFLYVNSLSTGVGSNDIGLDRGQLGRERVVKFWMCLLNTPRKHPPRSGPATTSSTPCNWPINCLPGFQSI